MTYLQLCNKVLRLLREDAVDSVQAPDDAVVELVAEFVNDAKRLVEDAHSWNSLRTTLDITTAVGNSFVSLTGAGSSFTIETIYDSSGTRLNEVTNKEIDKYKANQSTNSVPFAYAVFGLDGSGDLRLRLHATPNAVQTLVVSGYSEQADLSADSDALSVPAHPVAYYAYALACRERGEVGGQTAAEVFQLASQYLSDAIAKDASLNNKEYNWYVS